MIERFKAMGMRNVKRELVRSAAWHGDVAAEPFRDCVQHIRALNRRSPRFDIRKLYRGTLQAVDLRSARGNFGVERSWPYSQPARFYFPPAIVLRTWKRGQARESFFIRLAM